MPFQLRTSAGGGVIGDGHDGEYGIESAVGDVHAAVDDEDVVDIVELAVAVDDGILRIVAHAAGSSLVLTGRDTFWMPRHERGADGAGFFEPGFGARGLHVADFKGMGMDVAFEAGNGKPPLVADSRIDGDAAGCRRNLLRRSHDDDGALVPVAHGLLVARPHRGVLPGRRSTMWIGRRMNSLASMPPPQRPGVPWL